MELAEASVVHLVRLLYSLLVDEFSFFFDKYYILSLPGIALLQTAKVNT